MLRSHKPHVVMQECPGEIALCFSIYGCPFACVGCHSPELWNAEGGEALSDALFISYLQQYGDLISAVVFFGGEWQPLELQRKLKICRQYGLKSCLYTGGNTLSKHLKPWLDFAKVGPWRAELGGLDSATTNQRFLRLQDGKVVEDLTAQFINNNNGDHQDA